MRWGALNAAPDASTANWAFRVWTAISRSRSRITNSSAVTVSGAEGITGARAHPVSRTRPSPALQRVRVRLGEHRIQGLSYFRHPDELHGLDRRHLLQIALRQQAAPEAQLGSLAQADLAVADRPHLSAQAHLAEHHRRGGDGPVTQAGGHGRHDAEVQRRLPDPKPSPKVH